MDDLIRPIKQEKAYAVVVDQLRGLILSGRLKPGDKLPTEKDLAEQMQISRPTVREALRVLEAIGLLQTTKGLGSFVAKQVSPSAVEGLLSELFTLGDPFDLVETRMIIEPGIAALAAVRATEADIELLEELVSASEATEDTPETRSIWPDRQFHIALARIARNPILTDLMQVITKRMSQRIWESVQPQVLQGLAASRRLTYYHRQILEGIQARDPETARKAMTEHMAALREILDQDAKGSPIG